MEKILTKENIMVIVSVIIVIVQSNYFATKLDLANIKLEMSQMQIELKKYSDDGDKEILQNIEAKFVNISNKIDKLR